MSKLEEALEAVRNDGRYIVNEFQHGELFSFSFERGWFSPPRMAAFLRHFEGLNVTVVTPDKTALVEALNGMGLFELAKNVFSPDSFRDSLPDGVLIVLGGLSREKLKNTQKAVFFERIPNSEYTKGGTPVKNYTDQKILEEELYSLSKEIGRISDFGILGVKDIEESLSAGVWPKESIEEFFRISEGQKKEELTEKMNLYLRLFEDLANRGRKPGKNETGRYAVFRVLSEAFSEEKRDEEELMRWFSNFLENEALIRKEMEESLYDVPFDESDEERFLKEFPAFKAEAKNALKMLKKSPEIKEAGLESLDYNAFYDIVSTVLARGVVKEPEKFPNLLDTNRLILFVQTLYANSHLLEEE